MKKMMRVLTLLLILTLLPCTFAFAGEKTEGVIRVLLTRLNVTDTVKFSLDGSYTLNGISFQRGSDITVSSKTGTLMVYYEGIAMDAGKNLIFRRHALSDNKENGIRFDGIYELHPGDLSVAIQDGMLRLVLHAPVEEYLQGVVPYEMSNSFPLEALKAQAISARTYALKKSGSSMDYDVVDNTNDQAYMGIRSENKLAEQAILETEGICGVYRGKLAECYYSASNGGETEMASHVWGREDYDYLKIYADPYDLENPESVVMQAKLPKSITAPSQLGNLYEMILAEISEPMAAQGFDTASGFQITGMNAVALTTPKFTDHPNKLMKNITFSVSVSGMKFAGQEEEVSIFALDNPEMAVSDNKTETGLYPAKTILSVTLPYYSVVEKAMNLSINATDNEVVTITEKEDHFLIESRRYGHGVGMSQRGAQWMAANYGMDHRQILSFYYPGMQLQKYLYTHKMPAPVQNHFLATPGPAATPTPRPTPMALLSTPAPNETLVEVTNIGVNSYLNMRAKNSTTSEVLRQLYYGQKLFVVEDQGDWLKVRMDQLVGYVMKEYVNPVE